MTDTLTGDLQPEVRAEVHDAYYRAGWLLQDTPHLSALVRWFLNEMNGEPEALGLAQEIMSMRKKYAL